MTEEFLIYGVALFLFAVAIIAVWILTVRRVSHRLPPASVPPEIQHARLQDGELQASPIAEAVEERVKQILMSEGNPLALKVDFGTSEDGSLEIWVDDVRYASVNEIRDEPIRRAVQQAVEEFNH